MVLENPFIVYGTVKDKNATALASITVYIKDATTYVATQTATTSSTGYYAVDISQHVNTNGDTISVYSTYGTQIAYQRFVLNTSNGGELVNLNMIETVITEGITLSDSLVSSEQEIINLYNSIVISDTLHIDFTPVAPVLINDVALRYLDIVKRTSQDTWNVMSEPAPNIPFVAKTGQGVTQLTLNMRTKGDNRYTTVTSLRDLIRNKQSLHIQASKYIYGNSKTAWITPSTMTVSEKAGKNLDVTLSGMIDPYTLHSCDFLSSQFHQAHFDTLLPDTTSKVTGTASLKGNKSDPATSYTYAHILYYEDTDMDWTGKHYLDFWFRTNVGVPNTTAGLFISSNDGAYNSSWMYPPYTHGQWTPMSADLSAPTSVVYDDTVYLPKIDYIAWLIYDPGAPPNPFYLALDNIRLR